MRLVRPGRELTEVGADIRAALAAWGEGCGVLGGVAVFGCTPPGIQQPVDAVLVLPRGVIVVIGVDLPEPALKLDAPLHAPWTVDGWPLVRTQGAVNPALDAVTTASALARSLQSRGGEPLPVTTIVAVGPFAGQVTQPTQDLHRGVRVLHPSTTSMLAAARELTTYQRECAVEPARFVLQVLDERAGRLGVSELTAEGFSDAVAPDLASADTMMLPKVSGTPQEKAPRESSATSGQRNVVVTSTLVAVLCGVIVLLLFVSGMGSPSTSQERSAEVDGVTFLAKGSQRDSDCAQRAFGDVQAWLDQHRCTDLTRRMFEAAVSGRRAAVAVSVLELDHEAPARELQRLAGQAGTGGITDLIADGHPWDGASRSFDDAAQAVEQEGTHVRIVQAVWSDGKSSPDDVLLRALAERALRLPNAP
jgi:hypothetical protein